MNQIKIDIGSPSHFSGLIPPPNEKEESVAVIYHHGPGDDGEAGQPHAYFYGRNSREALGGAILHLSCTGDLDGPLDITVVD